MAKIGILGGGGFGTALAVTAHKYGHNILLWSAVEAEIRDMQRHGENRKLLPGVAVDASIALTTDLSRLVDREIVILAVASKWVRQTARAAKPFLKPGAVFVNVAKGFEEESLKRLSEVILEEIPDHPMVALSGPSHAEEIARGVPTTLVAASADMDSARLVQNTLSNDRLRIYLNEDIIGVELGGALKNVIALCAGVLDGLDLGDNAKAALMTRGIREIARLGVAMGGKSETFAGLAGIGDLIVTCTSMHSRNRRAGLLIGQGLSPDEAVARVGMTVEGYTAAKIAYALSRRYQVKMPITEKVYGVLYQGEDPKQVIDDLMNRPAGQEL